MERARKAFLILGGGGHGKVVADLIRSLGYVVHGYVDADPQKLGTVVEPGGAKVVINQDAFFGLVGSGTPLPDGEVAVALAIGDNSTREGLLRRVGDWEMPCLIHPSSNVSASARIGRGTVLLPRVVVNAAAVVGEGVILNTACVVEHDCVVASGAHLSPGSILSGGARVGERAWIGSGAVVVPGVEIGADAIVGAGAVVIHDVPAGVTVVGNPARPSARGPA